MKAPGNTRALPTAMPFLCKAAAKRMVEKGVPLEPLLEATGLSLALLTDEDARIPSAASVHFVTLAAQALQNPRLGGELAGAMDLREIGLPY
jgi:hypothetical protein